jgi:hypothetical protein
MTWVRFLGYKAFSALGRVYQVVILDKNLSYLEMNTGSWLACQLATVIFMHTNGTMFLMICGKIHWPPYQ